MKESEYQYAREMAANAPETWSGFQEKEAGWEDVEKAALFCPVLQAAVMRVKQGDTREHALTVAVLFLSRNRQYLLKRETDRVARVAQADTWKVGP